MCFPNFEEPRPHGDMGFDNNALKVVLESFVEDLTEESADLILERPRFAYAVVILADGDDGEICQASCARQLDEFPVIENTETTVVQEEDEQIQRALRELLDSREMLRGPSIEEKNLEVKTVPEPRARHILTNNTLTNELHQVLEQSTIRARKSDLHFHSLSRAPTKV